MSIPVDTAVIWQALLQDSMLQNKIPPEVHPAVKDCIEAIPELLDQELLGSLVNFHSFTKARLILLRYGLQQGYLTELFKLYSMNEKVYHKVFMAMHDQMYSIAQQSGPLDRRFNTFDEAAFSKYKLVLNEELLDQVKNGMTISELIHVKPSAFPMVFNTVQL